MELALRVQLSILFVTILNRYRPGDCQFIDGLGPHNIIRFENEPNVYIPCPFSGSAIPIWRINGVNYEAFNLPNYTLPVPYGLLITTIELGMDGKSFQCISRSGESQESSSIGVLKVEKLPQEYISFYHEDSIEIAVSTTLTFSLNHQRTIFGEEFKTFSWNVDTSCNMYRVTSVNCDDEEQHVWDHHIIQGTSLTIPSSFIVDSRNRSLYFTLESVDSDGDICNRINTDFAIQQSDITEDQPTSYSGSCVDVQFLTGVPVVVFPSRTGGNDCPCVLITIDHDTYNLTGCSCADDTVFIRSFSASTLKSGANLHRMCFSNLTRDMNNTVIHVYDSYRYCIDDNGYELTKAYRMYLRSFKLLIELPYEPNILVNAMTGEVQVSSDEAEGIKVSHYKVIVRDVTTLIVEQETIPHNGSNASFGDLFQQRTCSPYNVTVSAYSTLGKSNSNTRIVESRNQGNKCDCIAQKVDVDLHLVESHSDSDVSSIGVLINCTHIYYEDNVMLNISVKHRGVPINESFIITCQKNPRYHYIPQLQCGQHYDLKAYWIHPESNTQCKLSAENLNKAIPCPGKNSDHNTVIIVGCVVGGLLLIIILSLAIAYLFGYRNRWSSSSQGTNTAYKYADYGTKNEPIVSYKSHHEADT